MIFYERFYNWEVMTGGMLVRNTNFSRKFMLELARYEYRLPKVAFHGWDNGAVHMHLLRTLMPDAREDLQ